jgi:soluble lytic murein transglycosylase-like protein
LTTPPPDLVALAQQLAKSEGLDPALVCAVIEQESAWNPWAMRFEPAFFARYIATMYASGAITATEAYQRAYSWGLMQVMGQVARENHYTATYLSQLCDPRDGVSVGCVVLKVKLRAAGGDVRKGLLLWNGGGNPSYPDEVLARIKNYAPAPAGTDAGP